MKYLERLKEKISQDAPKQEATKVSKAAFVPFVAPPLGAFSEISLPDKLPGFVDERIKCRDCANWQGRLTRSPYEWRASLKRICTADCLHYEPMPDVLKRCALFHAKERSNVEND